LHFFDFFTTVAIKTVSAERSLNLYVWSIDQTPKTNLIKMLRNFLNPLTRRPNIPSTKYSSTRIFVNPNIHRPHEYSEYSVTRIIINLL
jgi:hypothetical protein